VFIFKINYYYAMQPAQPFSNRRNFLKAGAAIAAGMTGLSLLPTQGFSHTMPGDNDINIIGPKEGYSPQVGTLVSMMGWMRMVMLSSVKGLKQDQLDFLLDDKANTIGAMLYHLAATNTFYHLHTFEGVKWGSWDDSSKKKWEVAMELGEPARK